jgi:hypothetical protein
MDDPSGLVAVDASGHGRNGAYVANSVLGAPGPEAGTAACGVPIVPGGVVSGFTNPFAGNPIRTGLIWFTASSYTAALNGLLSDGLGGSRGTGITLPGGVLEMIFNGIGYANSGASVPFGKWNMLAYAESPSVSQTLWINGVQVYTAASGVPNAILGGDPLLAQCQSPGIIAHAAYFLGLLTTAQLASVVAGRVNPQETSVDGRNATDIDVAALSDLLNRIYAAVHQSFA